MKRIGYEYAFIVKVGHNAEIGSAMEERFKVRQAIYDALVEKMPVRMMPEFVKVLPAPLERPDEAA